MGSEEARADIQPPECPEAMEYLVRWAYRLCGRSGVGMSGYAPLSDTVIESFARLEGITLDPGEVDALVALDHAIREPDATRQDTEEDADDIQPPKPAPVRPWPAKVPRAE